MARRKSVCAKWTLVFLVLIFSPFVYTRPQETLISSTTNSIENNKSTENPIRYRYRQHSSSNSFKLPIVIGLGSVNDTNQLSTKVKNVTEPNVLFSLSSRDSKRQNSSSRTNRMITKTVIHDSRNNDMRKKISNGIRGNIVNDDTRLTSRRPTIKKVLTKWSDKTKYEDLDFSFETTTSSEKGIDKIGFTNSLSLDFDSGSTEIIPDVLNPSGKRPRPHFPNRFYNKLDSNKNYDPEIDSEENVGIVHSNKVHIIDYPFPSVRPTYVFTTPRPTPIITNVGNPKPWNPQQTVKHRPTPKPVRKKPLKSQYQQNNNHPYYPVDNFEVSTFQPTNAYTERIVIRPEEYAATNDDCPTIFLTLNNTFQGQGKEACPDLNIAVNTNVVNKNVVVESDEDDPDNLFPGGFGLPIGDDSEAEDASQENDYFESDEKEEQVESASVEGTGLSNYNADIQAESSNVGSNGGSHAGLSAHKPGRPHKDEDDTFSVGSVVSFFKPAINAMTWLAAINPFSFSIISMFLTPLVMLIAGYSGVAALFAPLGLAREASPKIVHVYRPKWEWDDKYKTWYLNSFPRNRQWKPITERVAKSSKQIGVTDKNSVKFTMFHKLKEWMKALTIRLKGNDSNFSIRKSKRKKRETWTRKVK